MNRILIFAWRYVAPAVLWAGAPMVILLRLFPDASPYLYFQCLGVHALGGCWLLFSLRGRPDLLGIRLLAPLPMAAYFAVSLWMMQTDDLAYDGVLCSSLASLVIWGMFWVTSYPRSATPSAAQTPQGQNGSNGINGGAKPLS